MKAPMTRAGEFVLKYQNEMLNGEFVKLQDLLADAFAELQTEIIAKYDDAIRGVRRDVTPP